jgi:ech hydrogenase subunit A
LKLQNLVAFLVLFPLAPALLLGAARGNGLRRLLVGAGAAVTAAASVALAFVPLPPGTTLLHFASPLAERAVLVGEVVVTLVLLLCCRAIRRREAWIPVVIAAQALLLGWAEFGGRLPHVAAPLAVDQLSVVMALIIGVVGGLIALYSPSYMADHHAHHPEQKDKRRGFFFLLFLFLSAMFGVVFANHLLWLYFFWEVTTLCSFLMIAYTGTEEATRNAFRALGMNALGGLAFAVAIVLAGASSSAPTLELVNVAARGAAVLPAALIAFAGLTKSAQLPFSSWLLGAMVAPTPVSALLHSSTMVKAGVFVVVKLAPALHGTYAGFFLALVGGVTFLAAATLAVTQSNAKRVLAWSTVSNLGLIVACAGVGTPETLWAAVMLIIFHAVAKALLFLGVGTIEHHVGSRDIEDMGGLIATRPRLALAMVVGILGMFLAPFGMLISKWACLKALADCNLLLAVLLAFGSGPTLFFWAKWLGKLISVPAGARPGDDVAGDERFALSALALLTAGACCLFPLAAVWFVDPWVLGLFDAPLALLNRNNVLVMSVMLGMLVVLPVAFLLHPRRPHLVPSYLAGANAGGDAFTGAIGATHGVSLRNYYLADFFGEAAITRAAAGLALLLTVAMLALA